MRLRSNPAFMGTHTSGVNLWLLGAVLLAEASVTVHADSPDLLWLLERRVRIQSPTLGPGWHDGLFNRRRTEPPCYVVIVWNLRPSADAPIQAKATIHLGDVSHLQAYTATLSLPQWAGRRREEIADDSRWQPIPSETIRANEKC